MKMMKSIMFKTCIPLRDSEVEEVLRVCEDIKIKDDSFRFKLRNSSIEGFSRVLVIYNDNKDKAYKRGLWLVNKLNLSYYWVK
jgi:hypothetical protein